MYPQHNCGNKKLFWNMRTPYRFQRNDDVNVTYSNMYSAGTINHLITISSPTAHDTETEMTTQEFRTKLSAKWGPFRFNYNQPRVINIGQKYLVKLLHIQWTSVCDCPACRTTLIATRFWVVMICPIIKCLTVLEFSFILFDLCLFITIFNFILNYVPIVTFWIFTYHKIWILLIIFCFIWSYWIIYFLACLEVFWSVVS